VSATASTPPPRRALIFSSAVCLPVTAFLLFWAVREPGDFADPNLLVWILLIAAIELVPVPATGGVELALSFPDSASWARSTSASCAGGNARSW
jgi:hypothetical protein